MAGPSEERLKDKTWREIPPPSAEWLRTRPRLWFGPEDIPALREGVKHGLKAKMMAGLLRNCDAFLDPKHEEYMDYKELKKKMWRLRSGRFVVMPAIESWALAYALTGEQRYGEAARDCLMTIIDKGLADVHSLAHGTATTGWRRGPGHDKHHVALAFAFAWDMCHGLFDKAQRARAIAFAKESIRLAREEWAFDWWQVVNNRGVRGILTNMYYALAMEGDTDQDDFQFNVYDGILALQNHLFMAHDRDGVPFEGPGYGGGLGSVTMAALPILRRGGPNLLTNNRFERMAEFFVHDLLPGGWSLNNLNDANFPTGSVAGHLHTMGTERGALIPWLARQLDLHPRRPENQPAVFVDVTVGAALFYLLWWKEDEPVRTPKELGYPISRMFPDRGQANLRTGWEADDWFVTHFCGRQQYKLHRQSDQNHVSFYALGEQFLVDAGYGHPHGGDMTGPVDRWFGCTEHHNCVLIDGADQYGTNITSGWVEGEMLDWEDTDAFVSSLGDASSCVGKDHRIRRALRRVVMVKKGPAPYLAVLDVNEKDGAPFDAQAHWHAHLDNRIERDGLRFTIKGKKNECRGELLWPKSAETGLADSYGRPRFWVKIHAPVAEMVTVFCPRKPGEPMPVFSCNRLAEGKFRIVCELGGRKSELTLSTLLVAPLRKAEQVQFRT